MTHQKIEIIVLRKLKDGPQWMRSFQRVKPTVLRLIDRGLVRRCAPPGGAAKNMIELTDAGLHALARSEK